MIDQKLVDKAFEALEFSHSPYSNFKVGACVETFDGRFFFGTNIENASYGGTVCAERVALWNAYSYGVRKNDIKALAIVTNGDSEKISASCAICRQVFVELLDYDTPIYFANRAHGFETTTRELVPYPFSSEDL